MYNSGLLIKTVDDNNDNAKEQLIKAAGAAYTYKDEISDVELLVIVPVIVSEYGPILYLESVMLK